MTEDPRITMASTLVGYETFAVEMGASMNQILSKNYKDYSDSHAAVPLRYCK